jgi:hypothetical protein
MATTFYDPRVKPVQPNGLLNSALGTGASAFHGAASLLDFVPRVVYGTANAGINATSGREAEFGNMNPIDNTGGIQASDFLAKQGMSYFENDPNQWEWRDVAAPIVDIAGDPQTYIPGLNIFSLAKHGTRALGALGGRAAVNAIGRTAAGRRIAEGADFLRRNTRAAFDKSVLGTTHRAVQQSVPDYVRAIDRDKPEIARQVARMAFNQQRLGLSDDAMREAVEDVGSRYIDSPELRTSLADSLARDRRLGTGSQNVHADIHSGGETGYFPRQQSEELVRDMGNYGTRSDPFLQGRGVFDESRDINFMGFHRGSRGVNDLFRDADLHRIMDATTYATPVAQQQALLNTIQRKYGTTIDDLFPMSAGSASYANYLARSRAAGTIAAAPTPYAQPSRHAALAQYLMDNRRVPSLRKGMFTNTPLADYSRYSASKSAQHAASPVVSDVLSRTIANAPTADSRDIGLEAFLTKQNYNVDTALNSISRQTGQTVDELRTRFVPELVAEELSKVTPGFTAPRYADNLMKKLVRKIGRLDKAYTLAAPASRVRDAVGGLVQNILNKQFTPRSTGDAEKLIRGMNAVGDYRNVPAIREWFTRTGLPYTKTNEAEALRQLSGAYLPQETRYLERGVNAPPVQTMAELTKNLPGQTKRSFMNQWVTNPAKTFAGYGEPTPSGVVPSWHPRNLLNVQNTTDTMGNRIAETTMAPLAAAEMFGGNTDLVNRLGPVLNRIKRGEDLGTAVNFVNSSQVDYSKLTDVEKMLRDYGMPFYAFNTGMLKHTAGQMMNPASRTSKLMRALNSGEERDQSIPGYLGETTAIPLPNTPEGAAQMLTGFNLMHEPAIQGIGNAANTVGSALKSGTDLGGSIYNSLAGNDVAAKNKYSDYENSLNNFKGSAQNAAYDMASMLSTPLKAPLEMMTGQSFLRQGQKSEDLPSPTGTFMKNLSDQVSGLRGLDVPVTKFPEPVDYPFRSVVDPLLSMSMAPGRYLNIATQLMDSKQSIGERALRATTGVQKVEIDQRRRLSTLKKRVMEEMQNINEVRDYNIPYIPKDTQEKMNPRTLREFTKLKEQLKSLNKQLKAMPDKAQSK